MPSRKSTRRVGRRSRKSARRTASRFRSSRVSRSLGRLGRMGDIHHFKEIINGGVLIQPATGSVTTQGAGLVMRLTDFPAYQQLGPNFEFARLNKCTIEFIPKANMQLTQIALSGAVGSLSPSGTLVTAIDQVPFYSTTTGGGTATFVQSPLWQTDASSSTGVTQASWVQTGMTVNYVRGIPNSKEKELYKKQRISFYPAFYDYIMTGAGTGAITNVENLGPILGGSNFINNGCVERKIKKWVSINNVSSQGDTATINVGPLYFGPVLGLDLNVASTDAGLGLYDIRLKYSMSFKRLRAII